LQKRTAHLCPEVWLKDKHEAKPAGIATDMMG
jgi:hypothetical protein